MVTTSCCPIAFHVLVTVPSDTGVYTPGDAMLSNATGSAIGDAAGDDSCTTTASPTDRPDDAYAGVAAPPARFTAYAATTAGQHSGEPG